MLMNMGSSLLRIQTLHRASDPVGIDHIQVRNATTITCGLRKPLRTRRRSDGVLSTEAIQAVQSLKLAARNPSKLDQIFNSKLTRLLKDDLLDAFTELQRQQHLDLALKVFEFMRKEAWYEPDHSLYGDLMLMFGKKKLIIKVQNLMAELIKEGLKPDTRVYTELIGAYLKVDMIEKAMETYEFMKASGCVPDELTLTIMVRNFEGSGRHELAAIIKNDCAQYLDSPNKFLKEVARKYVSSLLSCAYLKFMHKNEVLNTKSHIYTSIITIPFPNVFWNTFLHSIHLRYSLRPYLYFHVSSYIKLCCSNSISTVCIPLF